jgi:DNA-binding NtrC family response regulator
VTAQHDRPFVGISEEAMQILMEHQWPGNVRELRNLVESMVVLAPGKVIRPEDIPDEVRRGSSGVSLLPVPLSRRGGGEGEAQVRPELEFVFRTLVDLRVDLDQLRHQFDAYRREVESGGEVGMWNPRKALGPGLPPPSSPQEWPLGLVQALGPLDGEEGDPSRDGEGNGGGGMSRGSSSAEGSPVLPDGKDGVDGEEGVVVFRPGMTMEEMERQAVTAALREVEGNRRKAAELLGIGERTLYRKIEKFNLDI